MVPYMLFDQSIDLKGKLAEYICTCSAEQGTMGRNREPHKAVLMCCA